MDQQHQSLTSPSPPSTLRKSFVSRIPKPRVTAKATHSFLAPKASHPRVARRIHDTAELKRRIQETESKILKGGGEPLRRDTSPSSEERKTFMSESGSSWKRPPRAPKHRHKLSDKHRPSHYLPRRLSEAMEKGGLISSQSAHELSSKEEEDARYGRGRLRGRQTEESEE